MNAVEDPIAARQTVRTLHAAFSKREGLLRSVENLIENQRPQGVEPLSIEHARFLFFTVVNDHGLKSSRLYERAKALWRSRPTLFQPDRVRHRYSGEKLGELRDALADALGPRYPQAAAHAWFDNADRLQREFAGDPRNVFTSSTDARSVFRSITSFRGYGPKIGGMLLRAVVGLGFASLDRVEEVLVPVDIHDSRISFYVGALKWAGERPAKPDYYAFARRVQRLFSTACRDEGIPWLDVDRALWLIGSNGCAFARCSECPLRDRCEVGSRMLPLSIPPSSDRQESSKQRGTLVVA